MSEKWRRQRVIEALHFCEENDFCCDECPGIEFLSQEGECGGCSAHRVALLMLEEDHAFNELLASLYTAGNNAFAKDLIVKRLKEDGYIKETEQDGRADEDGI